MGNDDCYDSETAREIMQNSKRQSKIEKIITVDDYKKAKKVVEKYKSQLRKEVNKEQKQCKHEDFYRYEYDENYYINVCRKCFHEWEESYRSFLLSDYYDLTHGKFQKTVQDAENQRKYQERLNKIEKL
jgi:hypothetical protein